MVVVSPLQKSQASRFPQSPPQPTEMLISMSPKLQMKNSPGSVNANMVETQI